MNISCLYWSFLHSRTIFHGVLLSRTRKSSLHNSVSVALLFALIPVCRMLNSIISWSCDQGCPQPSHLQTILVSKHQVEHSLHQLLDHIGHEVAINTLQKCLGFLILHCVIHPRDTKVVKIPSEDQRWQT